MPSRIQQENRLPDRRAGLIIGVAALGAMLAPLSAGSRDQQDTPQAPRPAIPTNTQRASTATNAILSVASTCINAMLSVRRYPRLPPILSARRYLRLTPMLSVRRYLRLTPILSARRYLRLTAIFQRAPGTRRLTQYSTRAGIRAARACQWCE